MVVGLSCKQDSAGSTPVTGSMTSYTKEQQREYAKAHYQRNKEAYKARARVWNAANRKAMQTWLRELKGSTPCADCGEVFHYCQMDFDHTEGTKEHDVSQMISRNKSRSAIETEISKCELVCANCHRLRSWNRSQAEVV